MKRLTILLLAMMPVLVQAEDLSDSLGAADHSIGDLLITAKMTGMCGVIETMMNFQETTQMDGGFEFIERFWSSEAARLGWTVGEMMLLCNSSVAAYEQWQELAAIDQ